VQGFIKPAKDPAEVPEKTSAIRKRVAAEEIWKLMKAGWKLMERGQREPIDKDDSPAERRTTGELSL
jgi:hypothetical protein